MDLKKIIRILLVLVLLLIIALGVYAIRGNLAFKIGDSVKQKNAFRDYKFDTNFDNGTFRVEIRDLVTSTGSEEKQYYRYDIMVETEDKSSAKKIKNMSPQMANIINSVMTTFPPEKLKTEHQRTRVKRLIADKITEHYPDIKIKDLYFTNYVYN